MYPTNTILVFILGCEEESKSKRNLRVWYNTFVKELVQSNKFIPIDLSRLVTYVDRRDVVKIRCNPTSKLLVLLLLYHRDTFVLKVVETIWEP